MSQSITLSLITPCLNRREFVARALDSVSQQNCGGVEHLVMDGGSTDGTLDVLARYADVQVVSEPDGGLYDALNKGLDRARGDIVGFLNTDDQLLPQALAQVRAAFEDHPHADSVCGGIEIISHDGGEVRRIGTNAMKALRVGDLISAQTLTNARFFRRSVFHRLGPFDTRYPRCADRLFLARFLLAGLSSEPVAACLYRYTEHPGSLTFTSGGVALDVFEEMLTIAEDELSRRPTGATRALFERWHGWVAGYLAVSEAGHGQLRRAWTILRRASRRNASWPLRFLQHSAWHLSKRHEWR